MESLTIIIILVIALTLAIAYTIWVQSATMGQLNKVEILDITQSYIEVQNDKAIIHLVIHNKGTTDSTIETILVNNNLVMEDHLPVTIASGEKREIVIETGYKPGIAIKVDMISAKGNTYTIMFNPP